MYKPDSEANKAKMKLIADELIANFKPEWTTTQIIEQLASMEFHCLQNGKTNDHIRDQMVIIKNNSSDLEDQGLLTEEMKRIQDDEIDKLDARRDELLVDTYAWQVAMLVLNRKLSRKISSWSKVQNDLFQTYQ